MDAVVALRCFVDAFSEQEAAALKPLIPALLDEFFKLMNEVRVGILTSAIRCSMAISSHVVVPADCINRPSGPANLGLSRCVTCRGVLRLHHLTCAESLLCLVCGSICPALEAFRFGK